MGEIVLAADEAAEIASYLRRVKPHGDHEEQRVYDLVHRLEAAAGERMVQVMAHVD